MDYMSLKPCPKCQSIIAYNYYFKTYYCASCGYYEENPIVQEATTSPLATMTVQEIAKEICKSLNK